MYIFSDLYTNMRYTSNSSGTCVSFAAIKYFRVVCCILPVLEVVLNVLLVDVLVVCLLVLLPVLFVVFLVVPLFVRVVDRLVSSCVSLSVRLPVCVDVVLVPPGFVLPSCSSVRLPRCRTNHTRLIPPTTLLACDVTVPK